MPSARSVAIAAALGNLLQGWDNAAIAGALLYLKPEFSLERKPSVEGFLVASSLIGAWISTVCSGPAADWIGRRSILCISAVFYTLASCVMLWSPNVPVLIAARLLVGVGVGIAVTIVPIYIAEIAPAEIRGQLSTLPQFMGSGGLFLSYVVCFCFSLVNTPHWRFMLSVLFLPSVAFLVSGLFFLPESPRWLVSKGKMLQARDVLQHLRNRQDVTAELALLVEGLGVGAETSLQEWVLERAESSYSRKSSVLSILGPDQDSNVSWIAKPVSDESQAVTTTLSRQTTADAPTIGSLVDPVVMLCGSVRSAHESLQNEDFAEPDQHHNSSSNCDFDEILIGEFDEDQLKAPLLRRKSTETTNENIPDSTEVLSKSLKQNGKFVNYGSYHHGDQSLVPSVGIGGGWQLGWQWEEQQGKKEGSLKRVFLLQETYGGSTISLPAAGESIQAAALVGQPAQLSVNVLAGSGIVGPAMMHPVETAVRGPAWSELLEGGVRRALVVGVVLQVLQQLSGINAVLYYVPQILQQSGAAYTLSKAGFDADSASILGSGLACLFMLPSIVLAMRLMDHTGRRKMLLTTLPLLFVSLIIMIVSNGILPAGAAQSTISLAGVILYISTFGMGFGPIPNILASEIFPTRVRGVCIGICQITMWSCNILLTNLFPTLLVKMGVAGIFGCFAILVLTAWVFTFLKVPETKGMPLEVIIDFFAAASKPKTEVNQRG